MLLTHGQQPSHLNAIVLNGDVVVPGDQLTNTTLLSVNECQADDGVLMSRFAADLMHHGMSVPEPASSVLLLLAGAAVFAMRRMTYEG